MNERSTPERTTQRPATRCSGSWLAGGIVIAFAAAALISRGCESLALREWSEAALMLLAMLVILDWMLAGLGCLMRQLPTPGHWRRLLGTTLGLFLVLALQIPGRHGFNEQRALKMLVASFDPLVHAIKRFESERGRAPQALEELVPSFIPSIPQARVLGELVQPSYACDRSWSLRADVRLGSWMGYPTGELRFRPDQQYDDAQQLPDDEPDLEDGRCRGWHWRIVRW